MMEYAYEHAIMCELYDDYVSESVSDIAKKVGRFFKVLFDNIVSGISKFINGIKERFQKWKSRNRSTEEILNHSGASEEENENSQETKNTNENNTVNKPKYQLKRMGTGKKFEASTISKLEYEIRAVAQQEDKLISMQIVLCKELENELNQNLSALSRGSIDVRKIDELISKCEAVKDKMNDCKVKKFEILHRYADNGYDITMDDICEIGAKYIAKNCYNEANTLSHFSDYMRKASKQCETSMNYDYSQDQISKIRDWAKKITVIIGHVTNTTQQCLGINVFDASRHK